MAIFAHHDASGKILSLVSVKAPPGAGVMLAPRSGSVVTEIEGLAIEPNPRDFEGLRTLAATHKVASPLQRSKLARQD